MWVIPPDLRSGRGRLPPIPTFSKEPLVLGTQTPISDGLANVPIVPVLRNDHCRKLIIITM